MRVTVRYVIVTSMIVASLAGCRRVVLYDLPEDAAHDAPIDAPIDADTSASRSELTNAATRAQSHTYTLDFQIGHPMDQGPMNSATYQLAPLPAIKP